MNVTLACASTLIFLPILFFMEDKPEMFGKAKLLRIKAESL